MKATVRDGRIVIDSSWQEKATLKALPCRQWDGRAHAWTMPATPGAAATLVAAVGGKLDADDAVDSLCTLHGLAGQVLSGTFIATEVEGNGPTLYAHQKIGVALVASRRPCYLAYDMGTGKTRTAIEGAKILDAQTILIVCPKTVIQTWISEFGKWAEARWRVLAPTKGSVKKKAEEVAAALQSGLQPLAVVLNYESAWPEPMGTLLKGQQWDLVVSDEIHRIKAVDGKASLFMAGLGQAAKTQRVGLSGTPFGDKPVDIWAQMRFVDRGIFPLFYGTFHNHHVVKGGFEGREIVGYKNLDELHSKFYSLAHRVLKEEVLELPPFQHVRIPVELDGESLRIYRELEQRFVAELPDNLGEVRIDHALTQVLRLQQATSGYAKTEDGEEVRIGTEKREALVELLDDLDPKEPVVVFAVFHHDLDEIAKAAEEAARKSVELSGRVNQLDEWKAAEGEPTVLAVQIKAGGVGVDMTRARYCVFYSTGFSLTDYDQAQARLHRVGQTRSVEYLHLVGAGTIDEAVCGALASKATVLEAVLEGLHRKKGESVGRRNREAVPAVRGAGPGEGRARQPTQDREAVHGGSVAENRGGVHGSGAGLGENGGEDGVHPARDVPAAVGLAGGAGGGVQGNVAGVREGGREPELNPKLGEDPARGSIDRPPGAAAGNRRGDETRRADRRPGQGVGMNEISTVAQSFPVLTDPGSVLEALRENLQGATIRPHELPRIRIPGAGGPAWIADDENGEPTALTKFQGIVLAIRDVRVYWKLGFDAGQAGKSPDCKSDDGIVGIGAPGGECSRCPLAQFGTGKEGVGQACRASKLLFVLRPGDLLPIVVPLPPGSHQPLKGYLVRLLNKGIPYFAAVTEFSLSKETSKGGIAYSALSPRIVSKLSDSERDAIKRLREGFAPLFESAKAETRDAVAPPEPGPKAEEGAQDRVPF